MLEDNFSLAHANVAIIGLGLMGGSLALALKGKCGALMGIDSQPATLELALRQSIVDRADTDPARLLPEADIVILAAPVAAILSLLKLMPSFTPNPCIVIDLGSTKRQVVEAMAALPQRFDPLGGHPLCGKEKLSLANAERTLFYQAPFLLTPLERTSARAMSAAQQIIKAVGARGVIVDPSEHDRLLSFTSHLPFLLSCALTRTTPKDVAPFIGPGFKSASRLSGTPASMMLGVLETNHDNVVNAVSALQEQLAEIKNALLLKDYGLLENLLDQSRLRYTELLTDTSLI